MYGKEIMRSSSGKTDYQNVLYITLSVGMSVWMEKTGNMGVVNGS